MRGNDSRARCAPQGAVIAFLEEGLYWRFGGLEGGEEGWVSSVSGGSRPGVFALFL